jgi:toxin ParE1/3/4
MELVVLAGAEADIQLAFNRFEDQQQGLGDRFLEKLDSAFEAIRSNPEISPIYFRRFRRWVLHRFPFGLFYVSYPGRITVFAVKDPRLIRRFLKDLEN